MSEGARPVATAEGTLARTPFAHVLLYAAQQSLTGTLAVWPEGSTSGEATGPADRILVRGGYLVAARFVTPGSSLELGLLPLFTRVEASYAFYADQDLVGEGEAVRTGKVDPFAIIAASLRGAARDDVVREVLARVEGRALRVRATADISRFALTPKEQIVVELLRAEPSTAEQILASSGLPPKTATRVLYLLIVTKTAEPFDPNRNTSSRMTASQVVSRLTPSQGAPLPPRGAGSAATEISTESQSAAPATAATSPARAAATAPAAAAVAAAKPPSAAAPTTDRGKAGAPSVSSAAPASPARTSVPSPAPQSSGRTSVPPGGRASVPPRGKAGGIELPEPPPGLSPEHQAMWDDIARRAQLIEGQNFFEMLGVARDCSGPTARDAYFELVKRFHPDRLPPELAPLTPFAQTIFRYLTEAHDVVGDDAKRMQYIGLVKDGGGTPAEQKKMNAILDAAMDYQKAEVLSKRRDFGGALEFVRSAIALNPEEADYHVLLASVLNQQHTGSGAPIAEMLGAVDTALKLNERSDRAHYCKGLILKRIGEQQDALRHFKRAADLNPNHVEAVRELRLATMRGALPKQAAHGSSSSAGGGGAGGLLSKLFSSPKKK